MEVLNFVDCKKHFICELAGKKIKKISYSENEPIENNSVEIEFEDKSILLVYCLLRILKDDKAVLNSCDYYIDKSFTERLNAESIGDALISDELEVVNGQIENCAVLDVEINCYGDMTVILSGGFKIEIFIDISEQETPYYACYTGNNCISVFNENGKINFISGNI